MNLNRAKEKLILGRITFEDLPSDRCDPLWIEIREKCQLDIGELLALKRAAAQFETPKRRSFVSRTGPLSADMQGSGDTNYKEKLIKLIERSVNVRNNTDEFLTVIINGKVVAATSQQTFGEVFLHDIVNADAKKAKATDYLVHKSLKAPDKLFKKHELVITPAMLTALKTSEDKCQQLLNLLNGQVEGSAFNANLTIAFTAKSPQGLPLVTGHSSFLSFTATSSLTSLYRPMCLDVKREGEEVDLIYQLYDRIMDERAFRDDVGSFVCFGFTATRAYSAVLTKEWGSDAPHATDTMRETLEFRTIKIADVARLWTCLSVEAEYDRSVVYSQCADYPIINRVLRQYTHLPGCCRVIAIGSSSNRVYKITMTQWRPADGSYVVPCTVVSLKVADFAIKVMHNGTEFCTETSALTRITEGLPEVLVSRDGLVMHPARDFYALGYLDCSRAESTPVYFHQLWATYFSSIRSEQKSLLSDCRNMTALSRVDWWHEPAQPTCTGGVIIMRLGDFKPDEGLTNQKSTNRDDAMNQTSLWLRLMHRCGVVHRDVRLSNVMLFKPSKIGFSKGYFDQPATFTVGGGWQVIDGSMAGSESTAVRIHKNSGQYRGAGVAVRMVGALHQKEFHYTWTISDDWSMWEVMMRGIGVSLGEISDCDVPTTDEAPEEEKRSIAALIRESQEYTAAVGARALRTTNMAVSVASHEIETLVEQMGDTLNFSCNSSVSSTEYSDNRRSSPSITASASVAVTSLPR